MNTSCTCQDPVVFGHNCGPGTPPVNIDDLARRVISMIRYTTALADDPGAFEWGDPDEFSSTRTRGGYGQDQRGSTATFRSYSHFRALQATSTHFQGPS